MFNNPPYHISTLFYVGKAESMQNYLKKKFGTDLSDIDLDFNSIDGLTVPCTAENGTSFILIYMPVFNFSVECLATLVHEVVHASTYVIKLSGCHPVMFENSPQEDSDDETLAYVEGQMYGSILRGIAKQVHKKTAKKKNQQ